MTFLSNNYNLDTEKVTAIFEECFPHLKKPANIQKFLFDNKIAKKNLQLF